MTQSKQPNQNIILALVSQELARVTRRLPLTSTDRDDLYGYAMVGLTEACHPFTIRHTGCHSALLGDVAFAVQSSMVSGAEQDPYLGANMKNLSALQMAIRFANTCDYVSKMRVPITVFRPRISGRKASIAGIIECDGQQSSSF